MEKEKVEFMEEEELLGLISELKEKLDEVERKHGGKPKMFEDHKRLPEEFIEELLSQKERFMHIFKTEKGSIYFVLSSGKSFRIKKLKYAYELQPISEEVKFVNEVRFETDKSDYGGAELQIGLTPYETFELPRGEKVEKFHHWGHKITEILK